jgi:hypothetical protein
MALPDPFPRELGIQSRGTGYDGIWWNGELSLLVLGSCATDVIGKVSV